MKIIHKNMLINIEFNVIKKEKKHLAGLIHKVKISARWLAFFQILSTASNGTKCNTNVMID